MLDKVEVWQQSGEVGLYRPPAWKIQFSIQFLLGPVLGWLIEAEAG